MKKLNPHFDRRMVWHALRLHQAEDLANSERHKTLSPFADAFLAMRLSVSVVGRGNVRAGSAENSPIRKSEADKARRYRQSCFQHACKGRGVTILHHFVFEISLDAAFAASDTAQLPDFGGVPAETGQIEHPALILLFEKFDGKWFGPGLESGIGHGILEHLLV